MEEVFDENWASDELKQFRRNGPGKQTRSLLEVIKGLQLGTFSLLDIGGGVGAIQHDLAENGAGDITSVDASSAYGHAARIEARRRGYDERVQYHFGDFVELAENLESADVVTLDRVICCYDDMPALVSKAAGKARKVLGVIYPVETWPVKIGFFLLNLSQKITRRSFRVFLHSPHQVEERILAAGFERSYYKRGIIWQVVLYKK